MITPDFVVDGKAETRVTELASQINCEFGSIEYSPVHLLFQLMTQEEYYALLSIADVLLMTPERDANPLTPYDYVLCQKESHGSMILSEFTAQSKLFTEAFIVNPWDRAAVAQAINSSLMLPSDDRVYREKVPLVTTFHVEHA